MTAPLRMSKLGDGPNTNSQNMKIVIWMMKTLCEPVTLICPHLLVSGMKKELRENKTAQMKDVMAKQHVIQNPSA
jgi:hypothetical protein